MEPMLLGAALLVAFVNGANDNMKGVATLYGSGALAYGPALALGTFATAAGGMASLLLARGLADAFSGKGLVLESALSESFLAAVAMGAALTVLLATRLGFPVSTTHALVGGIVGAGFLASGSELRLDALGGVFALPLLVGPVVAIGLASLGLRLIRRGVPPGTAPGTPEVAEPSTRRLGTTGHLVSASLVSFARGLNDTPKILGLLLGVALFSPATNALAIVASMSLGGLIAGRRVAETLAHKLTPMRPHQGLVANLTTSLVVIGASSVGLPVSTTHVSSGGILGIGAQGRSLRRGPVAEMLGAWVVTLPLAAILAAGVLWVLR